MTTNHDALIRAAFECLQFEMCRLDRRWRTGAPIYTIRSIVRAAEDFATVMLEEIVFLPFDELCDEARMVVHDAYMRVLALADLLDEARAASWTEAADLSYAYECATDLLDALGPFVSFADRGLRRVTLEGLDIETACRWVYEQARAEAPS
jgi:hypothetical protein